MANFSQRYGYTSLEQAFQREAVSDSLRIALWNVLKVRIWDLYDSELSSYDDNSKRINTLVRRVWIHYLNKDLDKLPSFKRYQQGAYYDLKDYFISCQWFEVYNFLEFIAEGDSRLFNTETRNWINSTLEKHNAVYRFVDNSIVEITDKNEIEAIEVALSHPEKSVREHLNSALTKLSDKETPDYRNSIKESISAVEAACRILTENKSATLGDALKKVSNLHPAMKQAFDKLYGYTSDASGVRHSLLDEATITYADAKFMLVTCSAFVSYLNTNISKP